MKKSFVFAGIISAALAFTACSSSSSSDKSLAEKCGNGVTEECLESATWNMNAFYAAGGTTYTSIQDLTNPTTLVFDDSTFSLVYSTDINSSSNGSTIGLEESGTWTLAGGALTMNFKIGEGPLSSSRTTLSFTPAIYTAATGSTMLNLGSLQIHTTYTNMGYSSASIYEIFTGVEK